MPFHFYCENGHALNLTVSGVDVAQNCSDCHQPYQPCDGVVRGSHGAFTQDGHWRLRWDGSGTELRFRQEIRVGGQTHAVFIEDGSLSKRSANVGPTTAVSAPGGGKWVCANLNGIGGGRPPGRQVAAIPHAVHGPTMTLGDNSANASHGIAHIAVRHPKVLNDGRTAPKAPVPLSNLRDNLVTMTSEFQAGNGIRQIYKQTSNSRFNIQGVVAGQRLCLITDANGRIVTLFGCKKMSGASHDLAWIRDWG